MCRSNIRVKAASGGRVGCHGDRAASEELRHGGSKNPVIGVAFRSSPEQRRVLAKNVTIGDDPDDISLFNDGSVVELPPTEQVDGILVCVVECERLDLSGHDVCNGSDLLEEAKSVPSKLTEEVDSAQRHVRTHSRFRSMLSV